MDRICPLLATSDDGRVVVDGFDPDHRCRAIADSEALDRARQVSLCLVAEHRACERYRAFMVAAAGPSPWPAPAPDALVVQTRLVLEPMTARRRLVSGAGIGPAARRWAVGGALATVGVVAVASGVAGGLGSLVGRGQSTASPSPSASEAPASVVPAVGGPTSHASPSPEPTAPPTPTPAPTATETAAPTPQPSQARTYVVQSGDTLNGIAIRFGTTVSALQAANGLGSSDVILVGQVLIIP